ncbi:MAG: type II toxin-antitoxin system VapC family toxin [Thermomicrobiales bacterium]
MTFVVDASVTLAWLITGEITPYTNAIRARLRSEQVYVPPIWPYEVSNALLVAERRGRMSQAQVTDVLQRLDDLAITVELEALERVPQDVVALARQLNLTVYDASYVELALSRALPIATIDNRMRTAAAQVGLEIADGE